MMNRIEKKFQELNKANKKAFIVFITAGYPNLNITEKLIREFSRIGVDIIELGVPFSDPLADGPIIQESSQYALEKNVHLPDILDLVKRVRKTIDTPICLMSYFNPIFSFGEARFIKKARAYGVDGLILPDLPPDEGSSFIRSAKSQNLDIICFISPTTSLSRMRFIAGISRGFIYYVSLTGVTGPRKSLPQDLISNLKKIRSITRKPVCVGFGVSSPAQVRQIQNLASGVIVGSAIVKKIRENIGNPGLVKKVSSFVLHLKNV